MFCHATANNTAEEVEIDPVEIKKEEVERDVMVRNIIMLGRPHFRMFAEAVAPREIIDRLVTVEIAVTRARVTVGSIYCV